MARKAKGTRSSTFGNVRQLPSGRWQASYWHEGRRHTAPRTFDAKADGDAWLARIRTEIRTGEWIDPAASTATVRDYATEWLAQRHDIAESTRQLYQHLLDVHVLPTFGNVRLGAVTASAVRSWNAQLAKAHPTTAAKAYRLLASLYNTAIADRRVAASPCQVRGAAAESAPDRPVATIAEVQALADAMPDAQRIAVLLAAWCQLRRAELLGLRRCDVDLLRGTVSVQTTRVRTMGGAFVVKEPKSKAGKRTVSVPPHVLPELEHHLDDHVGAGPEALLLEGGFRPLRTAWDNARTKVGVSYRMHDLRHAGLTWSAATGATVAELMHRAGHKSHVAAIRYQHATEDRDKALAAALADMAPKAKVVPIKGKRKRAK